METASAMTTAVRDRPRRDWRSTSIPYVAAFSSIAMLGVFVICTSFVSSPEVLAQAVNGGSPAGAPQAQRPPTPTSKLLQPNQDPKEVGSPPSPANVTPSGGSRQPMVQAVLPQVDRSVSGVRNTPSMSVQAGRPRAAERNVGQRITIAGSVLCRCARGRIRAALREAGILGPRTDRSGNGIAAGNQGSGRTGN